FHALPRLRMVCFLGRPTKGFGRPGALPRVRSRAPLATGFHGRSEESCLTVPLFGCCQKEGDVNIASTAPRGSVRVVGVEPTRPKTPGLESGASANSATPAGPLPGHHTG